MQESWVRFLGLGDYLERKWQSIPVFLPGESHGQSSLVGYSPSGPELDIATKPPFSCGHSQGVSLNKDTLV